MTKRKPTRHPIGFVVNTHPIIGGSNATLDPKRKHTKHAKRPAGHWKVRCPGCGVRSEWQTGEKAELAAQSWFASHRCGRVTRECVEAVQAVLAVDLPDEPGWSVHVIARHVIAAVAAEIEALDTWQENGTDCIDRDDIRALLGSAP